MTALESWTGAPPDRWHAFYCRVTQEESVKTDLSIPNQIARAREVAAARGWLNYQIYVEPRHVSGELWTEKRPALKRLVDDIIAGRVTSVCVRHTDRLWRNAQVQTKLLEILRQHTVELWDFASQLDYRSAHGRFSIQVLGAASELELALTGERIREMKRGKARKGKTAGGPPPFGYTSQSRRLGDLVKAGLSRDEAYTQACRDFPVGRCWYIDETEAAAVRQIFELYTATQNALGCKRICRRLNELGVQTRSGRKWLSNYVERILDNPAYAGFSSYDEEAYSKRLPSKLPRKLQTLYPGEHPPLVSAETYRLARQIKTEHTYKRTKENAGSFRIFSLTGILHCPKCGSRMVGKWSAKCTRSYYVCNRRHGGGPDLCDFPLVRAQPLHREVWAWVHQVLSSPSFVAEYVERVAKKLEKERPEVEQQMAGQEKRRAEISASLNKYFRLFEASKDPERDKALLERVKALKAELEGVDKDLSKLKAQQVLPLRLQLDERRIKAYLEKLKGRLDERPEAQKALFQELRRTHGLYVRVLSNEEFVISLALPVNDIVAEEPVPGAHTRLFSVVAARTASGGSKGHGLPGSAPRRLHPFTRCRRRHRTASALPSR
jgi:site-specific DNA recombinase